MPRIVDGDNLLGSWPGRARSDGARRELAREIFRWSHASHRRTVIIFDGPDPPVPPPTGDVHYSGSGKSADDRILEFLRDQPDPRGWTLVTNDRSLADQARYLGARIERCDSFRRQLLARGEKKKPEGPVDVEDWLEFFGEGKGESSKE